MKFVYEELPVSPGRFKSQPKIGFRDLGDVWQIKASFCQDEILEEILRTQLSYIFIPFLTCDFIV